MLVRHLGLQSRGWRGGMNSVRSVVTSHAAWVRVSERERQRAHGRVSVCV
jgi:hypothetical protein